MGTGIAIVANRKGGFPVKIVDSSEVSLGNSKKFIESHFDKEILKRTMTKSEKELYMNRFSFVRNLQELEESQFIIEVKYFIKFIAFLHFYHFIAFFHFIITFFILSHFFFYSHFFHFLAFFFFITNFSFYEIF